jgi:hypothetical protein
MAPRDQPRDFAGVPLLFITPNPWMRPRNTAERKARRAVLLDDDTSYRRDHTI